MTNEWLVIFYGIMIPVSFIVLMMVIDMIGMFFRWNVSIVRDFNSWLSLHREDIRALEKEKAEEQKLLNRPQSIAVPGSPMMVPSFSEKE